MACQTFFFFFFQEKQATENGILQIYKHGENCPHALQTARLCEERTVLLPRPGSVPYPGKCLVPAPRLPEAPPGCCLSQIGQCTGARASAPLSPPEAVPVTDSRLRSRSSQSPPAVGWFPVATLSSL